MSPLKQMFFFHVKYLPGGGGAKSSWSKHGCSLSKWDASEHKHNKESLECSGRAEERNWHTARRAHMARDRWTHCRAGHYTSRQGNTRGQEVKLVRGKVAYNVKEEITKRRQKRKQNLTRDEAQQFGDEHIVACQRAMLPQRLECCGVWWVYVCAILHEGLWPALLVKEEVVPSRLLGTWSAREKQDSWKTKKGKCWH